MAGGLLSGKYAKGQAPVEGTRFTLGRAGRMYQRRYWHDPELGEVETLAKAVAERGHELASVAVAWVLAQPGVTSAIIGASRSEQLDASLAAAQLKLDGELAEACDAAWWRLPRRPVAEGYR